MNRFDKKTKQSSLIRVLLILSFSIGSSITITTTNPKSSSLAGKSSSTTIGILTSTRSNASTTAKTTTQSSTLTRRAFTASFIPGPTYTTKTVFTAATTKNQCPFKYNYIGCYADQVSRSDLNGLNASYTTISSDPIQECSSLCLALGFTYAGLQRGGQCYCGNSYGAYGVANGRNVTCNMFCRNSTAICGGNFSNSIYKMSYLSQCSYVYQYKGCYEDKTIQRDMNGLNVTNNTIGGGSIEQCGKLCLSLNFTYSGLQNGNECYCGNSYGAYNTSTTCNLLCSNNPAQFCGGASSNVVIQTSTVITNNCYSNPCYNGGVCHSYLSGFFCSCPISFVGAQCKDSAIWVQGDRLPDYSAKLQQIELMQTAIKDIKIASDILNLFEKTKTVGGLLGVFSGMMEMFVPSETELLFEYLSQQFQIINEKLDAIYQEILHLEDMIAIYMNRLSNQIQNLQIVVNAVSNINRMNAYYSDAKNMITDLQVYLSQEYLDYAQISDTCGTINNPQHYLNIINHYASASIFDSSQGSDYNLMYNVMVISNFADYQTLTLWYQKMFTTAFSLVYYGQICNAAKNKEPLFQNESFALMNQTFTSIISGFQNQLDELKNNTYYGSYVGCFRDSDSVRDLPFAFTQKSNSMNVQYCINRCKGFGFLYAGLQQGTDCWCGNNYGMHGSLDFSQCTNLCPDLSRTYCGGYLANFIFKTSLTAPQIPIYLNLTGYKHRLKNNENNHKVLVGAWYDMFTTENKSIVIESNPNPELYDNWNYTGPEYKVLANPIQDETVEIYVCFFYYSWWVANAKTCEPHRSNAANPNAAYLVRSIGHLFKNRVTMPLFTTAPLYINCVFSYDTFTTLDFIVSPTITGNSRSLLGYYIL